MKTITTYTEADVKRAYAAQERAMKKQHGSNLYTIAVEDLIDRACIETVIRATFESAGMRQEKT